MALFLRASTAQPGFGPRATSAASRGQANPLFGPNGGKASIGQGSDVTQRPARPLLLCCCRWPARRSACEVGCRGGESARQCGGVPTPRSAGATSTSTAGWAFLADGRLAHTVPDPWPGQGGQWELPQRQPFTCRPSPGEALKVTDGLAAFRPVAFTGACRPPGRTVRPARGVVVAVVRRTDAVRTGGVGVGVGGAGGAEGGDGSANGVAEAGGRSGAGSGTGRALSTHIMALGVTVRRPALPRSRVSARGPGCTVRYWTRYTVQVYSSAQRTGPAVPARTGRGNAVNWWAGGRRPRGPLDGRRAQRGGGQGAGRRGTPSDSQGRSVAFSPLLSS